jgi:hypothetical protein
METILSLESIVPFYSYTTRYRLDFFKNSSFVGVEVNRTRESPSSVQIGAGRAEIYARMGYRRDNNRNKRKNQKEKSGRK